MPDQFRAGAAEEYRRKRHQERWQRSFDELVKPMLLRYQFVHLLRRRIAALDPPGSAASEETSE